MKVLYALVCLGAVASTSIGGFYTDPNHYKPGSFAGTRMISAEKGDTPTSTITLVGTDDSSTFWTLNGYFTNPTRSQLVVDFSPKGGPAALSGALSNGGITWQDGNTWNHMKSPLFATTTSTVGTWDVGGFYHDPNHFKSGSFAGTRMISDRFGDKPNNTITLVGSDNGMSFWTLQGAYVNPLLGQLIVDFSPKGGPANLNGTFTGDRIVWQDGNSWDMQKILKR